MDVSAVIVTRGDVDLERSLEPIRAAGIDDIVIWNNRERVERRVYGRYEAIGEAKHDLIYTQDDDAVCPVAEILAAYEDDRLLVNIPADEDWPWVAWGAVFPRIAPFRAFALYATAYALWPSYRHDTLWWPDVIFAELTPWRRVDLGHENLEWAYVDSRMYRQPDHFTGQALVRDRCRRIA